MKYILALLLLAGTMFGQAKPTTTTQGLPPGLTFSSSGLLSGTPTAQGTYSFTVQVCDSEVPPQCAIAPFTITIYGPIAITTVSPLPVGVQGTPYNDQFTESGGEPPVVWSVQ